MLLLAITGLVYQCRLYKEVKETQEAERDAYKRA